MREHTVAASRTEMTQIVMPTHTNGAAGATFGGVVMQWIDVCGGVAAMRHCHLDVVTASIDRLDFITPIRLGEIVVLRAQVNCSFRTSMEVGCRVEAFSRFDQQPRYTTKAYLTFVAIDADGSPQEVPPLTWESDEDRRRFTDAQSRRAERLRLSGRFVSPAAP